MTLVRHKHKIPGCNVPVQRFAELGMIADKEREERQCGLRPETKHKTAGLACGLGDAHGHCDEIG